MYVNNSSRRSVRQTMVMIFLCLLLFYGIDINGVLCDDIIGSNQRHTQPVIKYRYEKENMVKSSDASLPIHDYHVVESGYNPAESEIIGSVAPGFGGVGFGGGGGGIGLGGLGVGGAGLGVGGAGLGVGSVGGAGLGVSGGRYIGGGGAGVGLGPIGYSGIGAGGIGAGGIGLGSAGIVGPIGVGVGSGGLGYSGGLIGGGAGIGTGGIGFGGGFYGPHGYGGSSVGANQFSEGHKNLANANFEKAQGTKGQQFNNGQAGYAQGNVGVNEGQGQKGYYEQTAGGRNVNEDGKHYAGGQNFNQKGANGGQKKVAQGHKKGHVIKGYKSTSHKDESGKTEEFYDEAHDEGDFNSFNGQSGQFGQQGASTYKGQHEDGKFNEAKQGKVGHSNNQYHLNKENANLGKYGSNIYGGNGAVYGLNNGIDAQSLLGHQENSKFFKHNSVPFYHHY